MISNGSSLAFLYTVLIISSYFALAAIAKSVDPLEVINIGDDNVCGTPNERFSEVRVSGNAGDPPLNVTRGSIELLLASLTPSQDYFGMNSTLSILKFGNLIESVNIPLGNMTQGELTTYNTPFFIPGGAVTGEAQIKFEIFNAEIPDILCFIVDVIIYDPAEPEQ